MGQLQSRDTSIKTWMLTNNSYPISLIDTEVNKIIPRFMQRTITTEDGNSTTHKLFYNNTMSAGYKQDEKVLQQIMKTNIKTTNPTDKVKLI